MHSTNKSFLFADILAPIQLPIQVILGSVSPGVKRPELDYWTLSSVDFKNEWTSLPFPLLRPQNVVLRHRDSIGYPYRCIKSDSWNTNSLLVVLHVYTLYGLFIVTHHTRPTWLNTKIRCPSWIQSNNPIICRALWSARGHKPGWSCHTLDTCQNLRYSPQNIKRSLPFIRASGI
jgi:hypothetical protein